MRIFDIEDGVVKLKASSLAIPEFTKIWKKDKSEDKTEAYNTICYITFLCDTSIENPYRNYSEEDREIVLKTDFYGDKEKVLDKDTLDAIKKYRDTQETVSVRLLRSAKKATDQLSEYFDTVDFSEKDRYGKPVYSARDVSSNLKEIGNIVKSLSALERQVKEEQAASGKIRGGGEIGAYELPDKTFEYGE